MKLIRKSSLSQVTHLTLSCPIQSSWPYVVSNVISLTSTRCSPFTFALTGTLVSCLTTYSQSLVLSVGPLVLPRTVLSLGFLTEFILQFRVKCSCTNICTSRNLKRTAFHPWLVFRALHFRNIFHPWHILSRARLIWRKRTQHFHPSLSLFVFLTTLSTCPV